MNNIPPYSLFILFQLQFDSTPVLYFNINNSDKNNIYAYIFVLRSKISLDAIQWSAINNINIISLYLNSVYPYLNFRPLWYFVCFPFATYKFSSPLQSCNVNDHTTSMNYNEYLAVVWPL